MFKIEKGEGMIILFVTLILVSQFASTALGQAGAGASGQGDDLVVAEVEGQKITLGEMRKAIDELPLQEQITAQMDKANFIKDMIRRQLIFIEAQRSGIGELKDVAERMEKIRMAFLIDELLKRRVLDKVQISQDEIVKFYEDHKDRFKTDEELSLSEIVAKSEGEAASILKKLRSGANFEEIARGESISPTASKGGAAGTFKRGQLPKEVENHAFSLSMGQISPVIKTDDGFKIIKVTDRKEPSLKKLHEVAFQIDQYLVERKSAEAVERYIGELEKKARIKIYQERLR